MSTFKVPFSAAAVSASLSRLDDSWEAYQSSRDRDGIYSYLSVLFELVLVWEVEGTGRKNAILALGLRGHRRLAKKSPEPFAALISITSTADHKTRSKWSRMLRYALGRKDASEMLKKFVKRKGGINACAAKYARHVARKMLGRTPMTTLCHLRRRGCSSQSSKR